MSWITMGLCGVLLTAVSCDDANLAPAPSRNIAVTKKIVDLPSPKAINMGKSVKLDDRHVPIRTIEGTHYRVELDLSSQIIEINSARLVETRYQSGVQPGDTVEVLNEAHVQKGQRSYGKVTAGMRFVISDVDNDWLGISMTIDHQSVAGWIPAEKVKLIGAEGRLLAKPSQSFQGPFVAGSLLIQKAKQFDDGLFAAVELAAQAGLGNFAGKQALLDSLLKALDVTPTTRAATIVGAATQLGGAKSQLSAELKSAVAQEMTRFNSDPLTLKPLGFYTWSPSLTAIFRQDRLLQTRLSAGEGIPSVVEALRRDPAAAKTYEQYLSLIERLTNPLATSDLRELVKSGAPAAGEQSYAIFPAAVSHEGMLIQRLYGDRPIPEGLDLMNELIARVRSRQIDLTPKANSGWYDYQTYCLEPLIAPEGTPESKGLRLDDNYQKLLTELFRGALALTREVHVKQLEGLKAGAAPNFRERPKETIQISPQLSVEPLATHYRRRAESYRFVQRTIEAAFGTEALAKLRRHTPQGQVAQPLEEELEHMIALFDGAAVVAAREVSLSDVEPKMKDDTNADVAARRFLAWAADRGQDPDLSQDSRMMVPVFYDVQRKKIKVWCFLGWREHRLPLKFARRPTARITTKAGETVLAGDGAELQWHESAVNALYPVMAEVYVSQLLDREEFRSHCDVYLSQSAILSHLQ